MAIGQTPSNAYNIFMSFDRMLECEDWSITIARSYCTMSCRRFEQGTTRLIGVIFACSVDYSKISSGFVCHYDYRRGWIINPWFVYSQKPFMTKRCEIILICRGVDHYYSWLCKI